MKNNFYCQKKCGGNDYKKIHMAEALADCEAMNFSPKEINQVIKGVHQSYEQLCTKQCKYCADVVIETQSKNKSIRELASSTQKH